MISNKRNKALIIAGLLLSSAASGQSPTTGVTFKLSPEDAEGLVSNLSFPTEPVVNPYFRYSTEGFQLFCHTRLITCSVTVRSLPRSSENIVRISQKYDVGWKASVYIHNDFSAKALYDHMETEPKHQTRVGNFKAIKISENIEIHCNDQSASPWGSDPDDYFCLILGLKEAQD
jgi:hypothetical protein